MNYAIDPELQGILEFVPAINLDDPVAARAGFEDLIKVLNSDLDESGVCIENRSIAGTGGAPDIAIRLYQPRGLAAPVPALLFIHGGGFVIGSLDSEHGPCLRLCRELGIVVVSVDYRLAPETPFPGGLEDCYTALEWLHVNAATLHIDPARVGVYGQSAGGGLAAATALLCRDRSGPALCFQYLGIPELDDRLQTPSMVQFVDTPMWNRPAAQYSWDYYLGDQYRRNGPDVPYLAAPSRAEDLSGLPPAHVTTMEFDPLRDEGVLYALKLMQCGVSTELHSYPGTFHGSTLVPTAAVSQREAQEQLLVLRRALHIESNS